eukprot:scaffold44214_cov16-Tisochrysis_lutea.AAC.1
MQDGWVRLAQKLLHKLLLLLLNLRAQHRQSFALQADLRDYRRGTTKLLASSLYLQVQSFHMTCLDTRGPEKASFTSGKLSGAFLHASHTSAHVLPATSTFLKMCEAL